MLNINFFENNKHFSEILLKSGDVLFDEGDNDLNLYIIKSGSLSIGKYTTTDKTETKQLAILKQGAIFGEGSLKDSEPKEVKISALEDTILFKINAQDGIRKFIGDYPKEGIALLTEIIDISNKRLLESNFLVTSSYQMSKTISEIDLYDNKNLFYIIDSFEKVIGSEYILYFEVNPVIEKYMTLKYDTRKQGKLQGNLIELQDNKFDIKILDGEGIKIGKSNHIEILKNKNEVIGYLIIGDKDGSFSEGQKKAITSISALISGVIIQKQAYEDEKNKELNSI